MAKTYEADVKGLGTVHKVDKPFDEALKTIKDAGASVIAARDLAYSRIQEGERSSLSTNGSYIKEGVLYVPDKTLFIRNSPLLNQKLAGKAVQAHRDGSEFYFDKKLPEKYQEQAQADKDKSPEKRRILEVGKRGRFNIPTNRFKDEELTLWLSKDQAEAYGSFLKDNGISKMPVYSSDNDKRNFANQLWLCRLDDRSELGGYGGLLDFGYGVRGVLNSAEGTQSKKSDSKTRLPYTQRQVDSISKIINGVKQGKVPASKLEKALNFLERLK